MQTNFSTDTNYFSLPPSQDFTIGPIQVVLNGSDLLKELKGDLAEMVKAEVNTRLSDLSAPKPNTHTAYILNILSTIKCVDISKKVTLQNNDLTIYLSGDEIRNAMKEQGIWHENF